MALPAVTDLETSSFWCFLAWIVSMSRCLILERGTPLCGEINPGVIYFEMAVELMLIDSLTLTKPA